MRALTRAECGFVSGGTDRVDDVIVIGNPGGGGGAWGGGGGWGGGSGPPGGWGSEVIPPPVFELPPCVDDAPDNIDHHVLMLAIRDLTAIISGQNDESYEYGALIFEWNGMIGYSAIYTNHHPGEVDIGTQDVPDGARIIGYFHSHPDQTGITDGMPSNHNGGDWDRRDALINNPNLPRGITADPNLLLVIYTNEDHHARIYDKNDKNTNSLTCVAATATS